MPRASGSLLVALCFVLAFFFSLDYSSDSSFLDPDAPAGAVPGVADNPDAASKYRFEMLGGMMPGVDLRAKRREALQQAALLVPRGLQKSNATSWSAVGPGNIGGRVRSILIHPTTTSTMLVGSVAGGVWKSTNSGASWSPTMDAYTPIAIGSMVMDPTNPNVVYAGTGEGWGNVDAVYGGGILKSTDFGSTWSFLASTVGANVLSFTNVLKLAADPNGIVYAATIAWKWPGGFSTTDGGLFRTTDGGTSWSKISGSVSSGSDPSDVICVDSSKIVFAVNSGGLFVSTNAGGSWTAGSGFPSSNNGRISLAQSPSSRSILYACVASTSSDLKGMYRSTDGGSSWTLMTSSIADNSTSTGTILGGQGWYDNVISVDPSDSSKVWAGGVNLFQSVNSGSAWTRKTFWDPYYGTPVIHADQHAIVFHPTTPTTLFAGNDGGIWKSTNGGSTWTALNNGLEITQFYGGAVYPTGSIYYGGTQDNGHLKFSSGTSWNMVYGGDGGYAAQDPTNPNIAYEEYVYLAMRKTTDGGSTWNSCFPTVSGSPLFIAPFAMDPQNSSALIAGTDAVYLTTNAAGTWTAVSNSLSSLSAVTLSGAGPTYLGFAGNVNGHVYRCATLTSASGTSNTWTDVSPAGNNGTWVRRVVVDPTNTNRIFACYSGYNVAAPLQSRHVWASSNQGTSWTDISLNLPNGPVHTLVIDPITSTTLYAGTETGVYVSGDNGSTWTAFSAGMPAYVPVDELVLQTGTNQLFAFTHGRSAFATSSALPVQISSFAAIAEQGKARLTWTTLSEVDNYGFAIEQSVEAATGYQLIPGVFVAGHGTTGSPHTYSVLVDVPVAGNAFFRLRQIDLDGTAHVSPPVSLTVATSVAENTTVRTFGLAPNYPNPFNPSTMITVRIADAGRVRLRVFDLAGREVAMLMNEIKTPGEYHVKFDATGLASGTYIAKLETGSATSARKMILMK